MVINGSFSSGRFIAPTEPVFFLSYPVLELKIKIYLYCFFIIISNISSISIQIKPTKTFILTNIYLYN